MDRAELSQRLSGISTVWSVLDAAHGGEQTKAATAQELLTRQYTPAITRYLTKAVGPDAADDLTNEFVLKLLKGEFRNVNPEKGRFRDFVKTVLFRMVLKHRTKAWKGPRPVAPDAPEIAGLAKDQAAEVRSFDAEWRDELLNRAWAALAATNHTYHTVLLFRVNNPQVRSHDMAPVLGPRLGRELTAANVRKLLDRARDQFARLLLDEVAGSLRTPSPELVEEELRALGLFTYCQSALADYKPGP